MPIVLTRFCFSKFSIVFVFICVLLLYSPVSIYASYIDEFTGGFDNSTNWTVENPTGISFSSGEMVLSQVTSRDFPYVRPNSPIVSSGDKSVEIGFRYISTGGFGNGFAVTDVNPPYGTVMTYPSKFIQYSIFYVWQNSSSPYLHLVTALCPDSNPGCDLNSARVIYQTPSVDTATHFVKFEWDDIGVYSVYLDTNKIFTSSPTSRFPTSVWFGHPEHTSTGNSWSVQAIDYLRIGEDPSSFPYLSQLDPLWAGNEYDTASEWAEEANTIGRWGCALTSVAMILQQHDVNFPNGDIVTPANLNTWLKGEPDGYVGPGLVNWLAVARLAHQSQVAGEAPHSLEFTVEPYDDTGVATFVATNPVILSEPGHFIVAHGEDGANWKVADPADEARLLASKTGFGNAYYFTPSSTNLAYILLVTEPDVTVNLAGSQQVVETLNAEDEGESVTKKLIYYPKPAEGVYELGVTGPTQSEIMAYFYDQNGNVMTQTLTLGEFTSAEFTINFDPSGSSAVELNTTPILAYIQSLRTPKTSANGVFQAVYSRFVEYLGYLQNDVEGTYFADLSKYVSRQSPRVISPATKDTLINYIELVEAN